MRAIAGASPNPRGCVVLDTRKTLPGLRQAQKYAVRVGGGANQRLALWHGILIKENHIAAAGGVTAALQRAKALNAGVDIQIEVETLDQLREALSAGARPACCSTTSRSAQMREAVALTAGRALLEASGGVSLERLRDVAATGVDRISIGKLTKDVRAIDYSMRVVGRSRARDTQASTARRPRQHRGQAHRQGVGKVAAEVQAAAFVPHQRRAHDQLGALAPGCAARAGRA